MRDSVSDVLFLASSFPFEIGLFGDVWWNESGVDVVYCLNVSVRIRHFDFGLFGSRLLEPYNDSSFVQC